MDLKAFVTGERPWVGDRGFAGIVQRAAAQAADRRGRGLRRRGRLRDRAGLRPDRRRATARSSASPRSSARSSPPAARCCACRSGCPTALAMELALTGDPITAERAARARPRQPRWPSRAARSTPRSSSPPRSSKNGAARADRDASEILAEAARLGRGGVLGQAGRDRRPGVRLRGRARGRDRVRREARPGLEGPLAAYVARRAGCATSERAPPRSRCSHR